jgi:hypothetical protein
MNDRTDAVLNGTLIGAGIGAIPGIYWLIADPNECAGLCACRSPSGSDRRDYSFASGAGFMMRPIALTSCAQRDSSRSSCFFPSGVRR